ncbi:prepilin-type N-terminal cleavage/methylation domain-containing protein [Enterobacter cloacae subsp. cloacae]|uniref:type II secretion system protein n=1 Tax=Enterobacter cloacae TaxID=550 RepID=UPI001C5B89F7|nr:prepilin-type N-terminal cleavage/methylation domain-containing protein [Enterobacter cloacae]MBW4201873.1 prepilin-type N-terminal cleavage/methylation domain-containing protein [Enterobacter cloacae subsp. cloacae]
MHNGEKGFTLIELLVVLAIIATLTTLVAPRYFQQTERAKEVVLKHNLKTLRLTLDQYRRDRFVSPEKLDELVTDGYLRQLPVDPFTQKRTTWEVKTDDDGKITDIHSGSTKKSLSGESYASW